jgi:hypothetical protein
MSFHLATHHVILCDLGIYKYHRSPSKKKKRLTWAHNIHYSLFSTHTLLTYIFHSFDICKLKHQTLPYTSRGTCIARKLGTNDLLTFSIWDYSCGNLNHVWGFSRHHHFVLKIGNIFSPLIEFCIKHCYSFGLYSP